MSLVSSTGNFTSPGYPSKYLANKQCKYSITIPIGKTIQLDFISFNLGKLGCVYAELKVYEGNSASGTPVLTKCGTSRDSFVSEGNQLYIVFKATLMTTPGFQIRYAARNGKFLFSRLTNSYIPISANVAHCHVRSCDQPLRKSTYYPLIHLQSPSFSWSKLLYCYKRNFLERLSRDLKWM